MKKFAIIVFLIFGFSAHCFAQGVVAVSYDSPVDDLDMIRVTFTCVADGAGALPVTGFDDFVNPATGTPEPEKILELVDGMWLCSMITFPGAAAPTALWDVEIQETRYGATWDVIGGGMLDRSATDPDPAVSLISAFGGCVQNLNAIWSLAVTNVGADAEVIVELNFVRR